MLESVIPDKRPPGTRSQNASFVHKGLGLSQQVLSLSETGKKARGARAPACQSLPSLPGIPDNQLLQTT